MGDADFELGAALDLDAPTGKDITLAIEEGTEFEGDIKLNELERAIFDRGTDEEKDMVRSLVTNKKRKWPKKRRSKLVFVPYTIESQYSAEERAAIARGIDDYHRNTCIR